MKKIILSLVLFLLIPSSFAQTNEYSLTFIKKEGRTVIVDDEKDWRYIGSAADFDLYVDKFLFDTKRQEYFLHGVTVFNENQTYPGVELPVKRIYTYGHLKCNERALYVTNQWYTNEEGVVTLIQNYDYASYISDLNDPRTIRNLVYLLLCGESV
jgi:hypothetical protein